MTPKVVLVSMPWTTLVQPSLGLGILKRQLEHDGIAVRVHHANLDLLKYVSAQTYDAVSECWGLNDFVFSALLDPALDDAQLASLRRQCRTHASNGIHEDYTSERDLVELFLALRNGIVPTYVAECAERILAEEPTLVGFTCMFDQTIASAAVAKLLKEAQPDLLIAFGGYAVQHDGGTQVLKAFPQVDCIARGDGEPVIAQLARASVGEIELALIRGVSSRPGAARPRNLGQLLKDGKLTLHPAGAAASCDTPPQADLTAARAPDYDDWFADVHRVFEEHKVRIQTLGLPLESSRGCWWGQKHHCTFCGIDEETLKYRSKSAEQVVAELRDLVGRYGAAYSFRFADYILPHHFHHTLLPQIQGAFATPLMLEGEIKANQTRDAMREFAAAGFRALQPGIESFSTPVLKRMRKGVSGIQNVQLLKWGYLDGVVIDYNVLYGLPGDAAAEYLWLLQNTPKLYHLTPPISRTETIITRFAPLQSEPEQFGFTQKPHHHACYDALFSAGFLARTGFELDDYCYYFERHFDYPEELAKLYGQLVVQINHWKERHKQADVHLTYAPLAAGGYAFDDTRFGAERIVVTGLPALVYEKCNDHHISIKRVKEELGAHSSAAQREVDAAIQSLDRSRLVWTEGEEILGLAVPHDIAERHAQTEWKTSWKSIYV